MPTAATSTIAAPPTSSATSAAAELHQLEATYGPEAQAAGHAATALYSSKLAALQVISVILTIAFLAATIYISIKTGWMQTRIDRIDDVILKSDVSKKRMEKSWEDVERHFFSGDDNGLKIAVIKADTLLDEALREAGIFGKDLGGRLKRITPAELPGLENVWEAHKLRNRIAHETNFVLKRDLAERALTVYEEALTHLGALTPLPPKKETTGGGRGQEQEQEQEQEPQGQNRSPKSR